MCVRVATVGGLTEAGSANEDETETRDEFGNNNLRHK
jgi:hypothetical protein